MSHDAVRVLYLLPAEGFGGAERQGLLHLAELPRHGVDVTALVGPGLPMLRAVTQNQLSRAERFEYFPKRTRATFSVGGSAAHALRWLSAFRRSTREVQQRAGERSFQLIFANRTFAWLVAAMLSRDLGIPYVLRAGSRPSRGAVLPGLLALDRVAPPAALLCNCRAVERMLGPWVRCPAHIVPNAIDTDAFVPGPMDDARFRLGLPNGVPLVGLAARPAPEKGFELLSQVVAMLRRQEPQVRFVVAGEFGFRPFYEQQFAKQGLSHAVHFLGHVEAMADFYRAMDVVVLTSRRDSIEGSPNALLEAMACERPLVATAVGGVPELVRHDTEGYLTRDDDSQGFAEHVRRLLEHAELRRRLGRAGRLRALKRHRLPLVVGELAGILRAVAATSPIRAAEPWQGL
jgi:glycosyltransferase involved in cell wall biosynthesis